MSDLIDKNNVRKLFGSIYRNMSSRFVIVGIGRLGVLDICDDHVIFQKEFSDFADSIPIGRFFDRIKNDIFVVDCAGEDIELLCDISEIRRTFYNVELWENFG